MKTMFIQIDDCQNNPIAIVKVNADNVAEAEVKALKAIHMEDRIYTTDKESALESAEEYGLIIIDENGEEVED